MSHFAVPLSMFCISVLNYILSCIKSVTFGHVPTVSTDGSPHTHQTFALLTPLSSTAQQQSTQLHCPDRCKCWKVSSVERTICLTTAPWWCHKLQYFYPCLLEKIIKCIITEKCGKWMLYPSVLVVDWVLLNHTIEYTKEKWKWLTDGSRAWLAVMIRCGQVFMM